MATLTGKITDVTSKTPENISSITVKAPSARIGSGTDVIVSSPATVDFNRNTGDITISDLTGGLSWLYIEGDGWADSIALSVADGMVTLVEAVANAAGIPALSDYIDLLIGLQNRLDEIALDAVNDALANNSTDVIGSSGTTHANKYVKLDADGDLFIATDSIVKNGHPVNKSYVDTAKWDKGYIPSGVDLNNWADTGSWEVSSFLAGKIVNAPDRVEAGRFEQAETGGGSYTQRYTVARVGFDARVLARTGVPGGNWNPWAPATNVPEWVPSGADLATMTSNGIWVSPSATWSNGLSGLPENASGRPFTLKVETSQTTASAFRAVQRLTTLPYAAGEPPITFERSITGDGVQVDWQENMAMSRMTAEFPTAHRVEVMKQASRLRRGGVVGTSGRVPVALSFDHGFDKFQSLILPHLIRLGLPCTVAVNPNTLEVGFADLQNWSLNHGIEIAHHGRDHGDVAFANASRLREKLLSTIPEFKAEMPEVISDAFIMPGASGTFYAGFDAAADPEKWWTHAAGRMIDDNFAVVTSALKGQFVPVTGTPVRAVDRMTLDSASYVTRAEADIRSLVGTGMGVHVFAHPNVIGQDGRTSAARLVGFLEFLASLRDAGEIEVLTVSGFAWADTSSDFRMNLAPESNWSGSTATIQIGRVMDYLAGAQVVVETTATSGGSLTMAATSDVGGLNTSVTHTATAGGRYRLVFSIPKSATTVTLTVPGSARSAMIV